MDKAPTLLKGVRLFFNDLWTPTQFQGEGNFRFNATFGILKTDTKQKAMIDAVIEEQAKIKFGDKWKNTLHNVTGNSQKHCVQDGDKVNWKGAEGCWVIGSHRQAKDGPPRVLDQQKNVVTENSGVIYSGCYVNATVDFWAQNMGKGSPGIRAGLVGIQKFADGDSFSGASKPNDDAFDIVEGSDADDIA